MAALYSLRAKVSCAIGASQPVAWPISRTGTQRRHLCNISRVHGLPANHQSKRSAHIATTQNLEPIFDALQQSVQEWDHSVTTCFQLMRSLENEALTDEEPPPSPRDTHLYKSALVNLVSQQNEVSRWATTTSQMTSKMVEKLNQQEGGASKQIADRLEDVETQIKEIEDRSAILNERLSDVAQQVDDVVTSAYVNYYSRKVALGLHGAYTLARGVSKGITGRCRR
eukprot:GHVN01071046.1.p1 GENE.GHVN01071046.1~~GHVN01071046.1.p1  ORF type:complete len:226 (+),score=20.38 GHVN01071046.1:60-737(+)